MDDQKHMELIQHLPYGWTGMRKKFELDYATCEKLTQRILEGGNFADRTKELVEILRALGVTVT